LQWYPLSIVSDDDWDYICGEDFYNDYIRNGTFVMIPEIMHLSDNYIQKGDGSFRDSTLVSPVLYLVLQAIGKEIADRYIPSRDINMTVYYSGNYRDMRIKYKTDYDDFYKEINASLEDYNYFIKTDITNFFPNINIDMLISQIDEKCNNGDEQFSQTQLQLFKELLLYAGDGHFPLIENSVASSYLATVVYLDLIDCKLYDFIMNSVSGIDKFKVVRYVDDMYILIDSHCESKEIHKTYNEIRNQYSSILKEYGLALNANKSCIRPIGEINQELKKSLYDEYINGQKHEIEEHFHGSLILFLNRLKDEFVNDCIDVERYNYLIDEYFGRDDIEFTSNEVFNYFVYESEAEAESNEVSNAIKSIIEQDISVLSIDPKRLGILIMKSRNDGIIKTMLNELFKRSRTSKWNSYCTTIAITYLLNSRFRHIDLLEVLKANDYRLYQFYENNCKRSFSYYINNQNNKAICYAIGDDWRVYYLFFMYQVEKRKNNNLSMYAFYKNYFDRVTANIDYVEKRKKGDAIKKPNYNGFYREAQLKSFYNKIPGSDSIIHIAHEVRNSNPISHASASLIDEGSPSKKIRKTIDDLNSILQQYCDQMEN